MGESERKGCGAARGLLKYLRPPHYRFFHTQCVLHDELYDLGGTEADRKKADKRLFDDMVRHSIEYFRESATSLWWFVTLSWLYWVAVRWFGRPSFNYH